MNSNSACICPLPAHLHTGSKDRCRLHTIYERLLVAIALELAERSLDCAFEGLLHCYILRLELAGAVGRDVEDENVAEVVLHPAAESLADMHRPDIHEPQHLLLWRQGKLLDGVLAVRLDDGGDQSLHS